MKEYDRLFYGLWCDEPLIATTDSEGDGVNPNGNGKDSDIGSESEGMTTMEVLEWSRKERYFPKLKRGGGDDDDAFLGEVFDGKQMANNGVCVKVHSSILAVSKAMVYHDGYYNHIHQQSQWALDTKQKKRPRRVKQEDDPHDESDDDDEEEDDRFGVDGWERIDDETFVLTKPERFEKHIILPSTNPNVHRLRNRGGRIRRDQSRRVRLEYDSGSDIEVADRSDRHLKDPEAMEHGFGRFEDGNILRDGLDSFGADLTRSSMKIKIGDDMDEDDDDGDDDGGGDAVNVLSAKDVRYNNGIAGWTSGAFSGHHGPPPSHRSMREETLVTVRIIQPNVDKQRLIEVLQREHRVTVRFCADLVPQRRNRPFLECPVMQLDTVRQREHLIAQSNAGKTRIDGQIVSIETVAGSGWSTADREEMTTRRKSKVNERVQILRKFPEPLVKGDTVGIGINFHLRTLFVTVNGKLANDRECGLPFLFRDLFVDEPLFIVGALKHYGNQFAFNFGQRRFRFDLDRYFSFEYIRKIERNRNYISRFLRNTPRSNGINKQLLHSMVLDHCIYEGFAATAKRLICKRVGVEKGKKVISHLEVSHDVFGTMELRRCIRECIESGSIHRARHNIQKLGISHFSMKYPVAWFQILRQELVELLRADKVSEAQKLYRGEILEFESFLIGDLDAENGRVLREEVSLLGTLLVNCVHNKRFDLGRIVVDCRFLFDVKRRYRLRDIVHNLIYRHMKQRDEKRMQCLYSMPSQCSKVKQGGVRRVKMYDSQLNMFLKHLCAVYDCYKSNFGNYCESIRIV